MNKKAAILTFVFGIFLVITCTELKKEMLVSTGEITNILTNSADASGSVVDLGEGATQVGHCWAKTPNADITSAGKTQLGLPAGTTVFSSTMNNLEASTKYYYKAYISNGSETVYGKELFFITKVATAPAITTTAITNITLTGASSGGNITGDGGTPVIARGVCWNSFTSPTISNNKTSDGTGTGNFTSDLTGLTAGTTYYVRSYATNNIGTTYGNELSFITTAASMPTVTTMSISAFYSNSALCGGTVISDGGSPVLARGVCWSTSTGPTVSNSKTTNGTGTGNFGSSIEGLSPLTKYYVRAYATNIAGTAYGSELNFTTEAAPVTVPTLTTVSIGSISSTSATSGGDISSDGGATITSRGVCWNTTGNPTPDGLKTTDGTGTGTYSSAITGLASNTKYYVRAYAINNKGTGFGSEYNFTTLSPSSAVLSTLAITSIAKTSATGGGNITSDGGSSITSRGICWSLNQSPTLADSYTTNEFGTGIFNSQLINLSPGKTYYVRAYAINSTGTAYGNQVSFLTASDFPKVTTSAVGTVTATTAEVGGEVLDNNGSTVTARGVCFNTIGSPSISDNTKSETGAMGIFSISLTGLTPNTDYYVRAFATNSVGTAYGSQVMLVTTASIPSLTTTAVTSITTTTASSGGSITSDNGSTVLVRGVCWSTSTGPVIGGSNQTNDGGSSGSFTSSVTGLSPNTTYYLRAYATNGKGTAYGNEVNFLTNSVSLTAPGAPTAVSATKGNAQVTVAFTAPANNGGSVITEYKVTSNPGGLIVTGLSSPLILNGLINGTAYTFTVTATNIIGTGPASSASNSVTPSTIAGAPVIGTATGGFANATVTFTAPASDGGSAITEYTATSSPDGITGIAGTSPIIVSGLANKAYTFTVTATNDNGISAASSPSNSATPTLIPGAPAIGTATAGNGSASVAFFPPVSDGGSEITVYIVKSNPGGLQGTGVVSPVNVSGLTNGTSYTFTVTATNINGTGPISSASNSVTPSLPAPTLTNFPNISKNYGDAPFTVTPPNSNSTGIFTYYSGNTAKATIGASSGTITILSVGTITITASQASTASYLSGSIDAILTVNAVVPTVTTTVISNISSTSASSGGNVTSEGGAMVTVRGVCWSTTTTPTISNSHSEDGNLNGVYSSSLNGLTPGQTYYVRAYATNSAGTGYGTELSFISLRPPTAGSSSATSVTSSSATLNGAVNANGSNTTISFEYGLTNLYGSSVAASPGSATGTSLTNVSAALTSLTSGTLYHFRVKAESAGGTTFSDDLTFSTNCNLPSATTVSVTNLTNTSVTLNGTVNPNGCATTVTFEYGETTAYGLTATAVQSPVSGSSLINVSVNLTGLPSGQLYHYMVKAVSGGTVNGSDLTFTTTIKDIDGNAYNKVTIGTQVWMKENLKTTKYTDNASIPNVTVDATWAGLTTPAYSWYSNNSAFKATYGALYNWYAVNTGKLCPAGWHMPTDADWTALGTYLGGWTVAGGKLKEIGTILWTSPNTGATNETGFSATGGGVRNYSTGVFEYMGLFGYWWNATESAPYGKYKTMNTTNDDLTGGSEAKSFGYSVRCLRD